MRLSGQGLATALQDRGKKKWSTWRARLFIQQNNNASGVYKNERKVSVPGMDLQGFMKPPHLNQPFMS